MRTLMSRAPPGERCPESFWHYFQIIYPQRIPHLRVESGRHPPAPSTLSETSETSMDVRHDFSDISLCSRLRGCSEEAVDHR